MDGRELPAFGDLLRRFRDGAGLTQEELAERTGLSPGAISLLERNPRQRPRPYTVRKLAEALDLSQADRARFEAAARGLRPDPAEAPTSEEAPPVALAPLRRRGRRAQWLAGALGVVLVGAGLIVGVRALADRSAPASAAQVAPPPVPPTPGPSVAGAWASAGSMATTRNSHTATVLANGKVLVVGGDNTVTAYATAELYDPVNYTWSSAGAMSTPRSDHTATLLQDGRVLVVGGHAGTTTTRTAITLASAELYDPASNTWSSVAPMSTPRHLHSAALLTTGKVLVVGGVTGSFGTLTPLASAQIYDPATNSWSGAAAAGIPLFNQGAAIPLANGKVLLTGGNVGGRRSSAAELYDPATDTWSSAGDMSTVRALHSVTRLTNGRVLVAGGLGQSGGAVDSAELYDPETNTWSKASPLTTPRGGHTATLLGNGKVLVAGGTSSNGNRAGGPLTRNTTTILVSAELYNPATNAWTSAGSMATARAVSSASLLDNGKILVAGGWQPGGGDILAAAEIYDPTGRPDARASALDATAYLNNALDFLRKVSMLRDRVDWEKLRRATLAQAQSAETTADTYPALRFAMEQLGDDRSLFLSPDQAKQARQGIGQGIVFPYKEGGGVGVVPYSAAERAGVRTGDVLLTLNGQRVEAMTADQRLAALQGSTIRLTLQRAGQNEPVAITLDPAEFPQDRPPSGHRLDGDLGYLELPATCEDPFCGPYPDIAHELIRKIDETPTCGWMVDLRRTYGGELSLLHAAAGPILGEGDLPLLAYVDGSRFSETFRDNRVAQPAGQEGAVLLASVDNPYRLKRPLPPVAVLTSRMTMRNGELLTLAFRGRPNARRFGEPTGGVPTVGSARTLGDGAQIHLTTAFGVDRTGQTASGEIAPDQPVPIDWANFGTDRDPVIRTAAAWLESQPCARP
jgi:C-terminal processing protease CtpA/Prc/N-acetylneuraminic acid mutarotase/transcriptional regulator with XRE-family HTH domain